MHGETKTGSNPEKKNRRCVTVREVAEALGMRYNSAYTLLRRIAHRGMLTKKFIGRVAVYCGEAAVVESLLNKKRNSKVKTLTALISVRDILQREGCVSRYTLQMLGFSSQRARYLAMRLVEEGEAVHGSHPHLSVCVNQYTVHLVVCQ